MQEDEQKEQKTLSVSGRASRGLDLVTTKGTNPSKKCRESKRLGEVTKKRIRNAGEAEETKG